MQSGLEPLDWGEGLPRRFHGRAECPSFLGVATPVVAGRVGKDTTQDGAQTPVVDPAAGRGQQPKGYASNRRMDARCFDGEPDQATRQDIERDASHAEQRHSPHGREADAADRERGPADLAAIAKRDDEDSTDIVDDSEREQENAQALRGTSPQERQAANGEGGVRRHHHTPAMRPGSA